MKMLDIIVNVIKSFVHQHEEPTRSLCAVCQTRNSVSVASSGIGIALSNGYCVVCLQKNAEPYDDLVGQLYSVSAVDDKGNLITSIAEWFWDTITYHNDMYVTARDIIDDLKRDASALCQSEEQYFLDQERNTNECD